MHFKKKKKFLTSSFKFENKMQVKQKIDKKETSNPIYLMTSTAISIMNLKKLEVYLFLTFICF